MRITKRLEEEIRQAGATFEVAEDGMVNIDLPAGKAWAATGEHTILVASVAEARDLMRHGTEPCPEPKGCDFCDPEDFAQAVASSLSRPGGGEQG